VNVVKKNTLGLPLFTLLGSVSTLVCCVLPAAFVALGLGASVAGFIGAFPQVTWLSEHKNIVFGTAGVLIVGAAVSEWRRRRDPCPLEPELAQACGRLRRWSRGLLVAAAVIYAASAFFVFVLPKFI
jgi:hypothetical protein